MDAKYLLGIVEIDVQHSAIFAAIESLREIRTINEHPEMYRVLVGKLHDLLVDHFDFEELFMGSINCPERLEHIQRHLEIRNLLEDLANTPQTAMDGRLWQILDTALSEHLLKYDVTMGATVEHLVAQVHRHESKARHRP